VLGAAAAIYHLQLFIYTHVYSLLYHATYYI